MARSKKNQKENNILNGISFLEESSSSREQESVSELSLTPSKHCDIIETTPVSEVTEVSSAFGRHSSSIYKVQVGQVCPHCNYAILEEDISFSGKPCEFFVYCPNCNAHICTYQPMEHQKAFHEDEHMKKLYAGGFGSAKTYTCGMEFIAYALQIPNGAGLIGAATWGQASDTCLKFITDNLPAALVARSNQDKVNWNIDLINGFKISAKALDKEGKIRSANLNIIWVEEASEVSYNIIVYIAARLRNKTAYFKGKNRLKMLLSSNPDVGWLATDWLMCSDKIYYHGDTADRYEVLPEKQDKTIVTHISATSANVYLPPDYEENLAKNKPQWWVNRYLKGSFKYTEGLVYPNFTDWFCEPFIIPAHWKRITGTDFGRRDPTAHLVAALDPINMIIYVYAEVEETLDDKTLDEVILQIKQTHDFPDYLLAYPHQCDPRGRNSDQVSGQSWIDAYRERGLFMQPATDCEGNSLAPTILKIQEYANAGRLKFFNTLRKLRDSLSKYRYPKRDVEDADKNQGEKPMDKHNHLPDAMRYMLSLFPAFPQDPTDFSEIWRQTIRKTTKYNPLSSNSDFNNGYGFDLVGDYMDNFG